MLANFSDWIFENTEAFKPGPGLFCTAHIILMILMALLIVFLLVFAFKHPVFARKLGAVMVILMAALRLLRMILQVASGAYSVAEVLPWQLCHFICFALLVIYFLPSSRFSLPILSLAVLGGTMTFIFGDYYYINVPSFYIIESVYLHFALIGVTICYVASRRPKYNWFSILQVPIFLAILCGWASIGNAILPDHNYMYIQKNVLPFNLFPGYHFFLTYLIIGIILLAIVAITYFVIKFIKSKKAAKIYTAKNVEN